MAAFPLTATRALSLWGARRAARLPAIQAAVDAAKPVAEIVRPLVAEMMAELVAETRPRLWAWLTRALRRAGDKIDRGLTWEAIRNDDLRQWLENNDNPYDLLRPIVVQLSEAIEADVQADAEALEDGRELLALLGGGAGRSPGFFRERGLTMVERAPVEEQPTVEETALTVPEVDERDTMIADLIASNRDLSAEVEMLSAELAARHASATSIDADAVIVEPEVIVIDEREQPVLDDDLLAAPEIGDLEALDAPEPRALSAAGERARAAVLAANVPDEHHGARDASTERERARPAPAATARRGATPSRAPVTRDGARPVKKKKVKVLR